MTFVAAFIAIKAQADLVADVSVGVTAAALMRAKCITFPVYLLMLPMHRHVPEPH